MLQLCVWRYTADWANGGDGTKLMALGVGRSASSESSRGRRWAFWRRGGAAAERESDEEALGMQGRRRGSGAGGEWSRGSGTDSESEGEEDRKAGGGGGRHSRYAPVGRVDAAAGSGSDSELEALPKHRSKA